MHRIAAAVLRTALAATALVALGACHTDPAAEASAQGERVHECLVRSQQDNPGASDGERQKRCHDQVGRAAFEVPPAAVPAPVH